MPGNPLDPHHATLAGREDNLDLNAVVSRYQPMTFLVSTGGSQILEHGGFRVA